MNKNVNSNHREEVNSGQHTIPNKVSIELCKVAGHLCGDGGLSAIDKKGRYVVYYANKENILIDDFKKSMYSLFKAKPNEQYINDIFSVSYSSIIGLMLWFIFGDMSNKNKHVPSVVLKTNKKLKAYFIKAVFDDEASVRVKEHKIEIKMANKNLISSLKALLKEIGVMAGEVKRHTYYKNKKNRSQFRIIISNKKNLTVYYKKIGFNHPKKKQLLMEAINSYKLTHYSKEELTNIILNLLGKNKEMKMVKIASKVGRKPHSQLNKVLMVLVKEGKIGLRKECKGANIYFDKENDRSRKDL